MFQPSPQRFLLAARSTMPFQHVPLGGLAPAVARSFAFYQWHAQHEYAYHYRMRAFIEPTSGFVLGPDLRPIPASMPHYWENGMPAWRQLVHERLKASVMHVPQVVSLREFGDGNYYHFFNDVLGKLALLNELGVGKNWPLLASARLAAQPYFQELLRCSALGQRQWIVQQDQFIHASEVIFCKPMPHIRRNFDYVLDRIALGAAEGNRRVLLLRSKGRGRWLENGMEVAEICRSFGFEVVDADELRLKEQIALFRAARVVVGIHGAGLVNCMFRRGGKLDLLELFPPDNIPPHYFWLAHNYGFGYHALVGTAGTQPNAFRVDVDVLRAKLEMFERV